MANVSLSTEHSYGPRVLIPHQNVCLVISLIDCDWHWLFFRVTRPLWSLLGEGYFHHYCSNSINFVSTVLIYNIHVGCKLGNNPIEEPGPWPTFKVTAASFVLKRLRYRSKSKNINTRWVSGHIHIGLKLVRNPIKGWWPWTIFKVTATSFVLKTTALSL